MSIRRDGFLVPILVRPLEIDRYEVISGNHRLLAAQELGLSEVLAVVKEMDTATARTLAINLNTIHGELSAEVLAPFLAELDSRSLADLHFDDALLEELLRFDTTLAERLAQLDAPASIDRLSPQNPLPTCICPRCHRRHAPPTQVETSDVL